MKTKTENNKTNCPDNFDGTCTFNLTQYCWLDCELLILRDVCPRGFKKYADPRTEGEIK
jgi:hypothetical protein